MTYIKIVLLMALVLLGGYLYFFIGSRGEATPTSDPHHDLIRVEVPTIGAHISSPLIIQGVARGFWFFEASFPVELVNAHGEVVATHYATAEGEWMTESFVPFHSELTFAAQESGSKGTLILRKDNPSGLPEHDDLLEVPVVFE